MERFVHDLAVEQAARGHSVQVLAHEDAAHDDESPSLPPSLGVTRAAVWKQIGGYAPLAPAMPWLLLRQLLRERGGRPSVIHFHAPNPAALPGIIIPRAMPIVLHWHADVLFPDGSGPGASLLGVWRFFEQRLLRRADRIIATSAPYAAESTFLAPFATKCRVIPLGLPERQDTAPSSPPLASAVPQDWNAAAFLSEGAPGTRILSTGRLAHYKGYRHLITALAALPQARLCLIGRGEEQEFLARRIAELGLGDRVLLAGSVSDAERDACLALCDIFCLSSVTRGEAFGLALLEAMQQAKPCVATRVAGSGMSFAVVDGETGLLVEPESSQALAAALQRLISDTDLRRRMGHAGQARAAALFSIRSVADATDALYQELVAHHA